MTDRFYWYSNRFAPSFTLNPEDEDEKSEISVINVDQSLAYLGYNKDFGPLNLGQLHSFCRQV